MFSTAYSASVRVIHKEAQVTDKQLTRSKVYLSASAIVHSSLTSCPQLQINVEKTIDYVVDDDRPYTPSYQMDDRSSTKPLNETDMRSLSPA